MQAFKSAIRISKAFMSALYLDLESPDYMHTSTEHAPLTTAREDPRCSGAPCPPREAAAGERRPHRLHVRASASRKVTIFRRDFCHRHRRLMMRSCRRPRCSRLGRRRRTSRPCRRSCCAAAARRQRACRR